MSDPAAFLATIIANPEEDGPRLVYADWLEEHGECDRAEFIRVQCEFATTLCHQPKHDEETEPRTVESWFCNDSDCRHCTLSSRASRLMDGALLTWNSPPASRVDEWWFVRGFIDSIKLSWPDFAAHADAIIWRPSQDRPCPPTAHPIRNVTLTTMPAVEMAHPTHNGPIRLRGRTVWLSSDSVKDANDLVKMLLTLEWPGIEFVLPEILAGHNLSPYANVDGYYYAKPSAPHA